MTITESERFKQAAQEYTQAVADLYDAITVANIKKLENTTAMIKQATKLLGLQSM